MPKVLVVYDSLTGNTARAAELIAEGAKAVKGVEVEVRKVDVVSVKEIKEAEAVILGCPTHGFTASQKMKAFLSRPEVREALKGKIGAIFASCIIIPKALKWLEKTLENLGFKLMGKLGVRGSPKGSKENAFKNLGKEIAEHVKSS
ncbi:MAG: flavodoxin domain-containing protein [Candidatus Bathyarchaeia archaeon]